VVATALTVGSSSLTPRGTESLPKKAPFGTFLWASSQYGGGRVARAAPRSGGGAEQQKGHRRHVGGWALDCQVRHWASVRGARRQARLDRVHSAELPNQLQALHQLQSDIGGTLDPSFTTQEGYEDAGGEVGGGTSTRSTFLQCA
jgi:hypothetical protein